VTEMTRNDPGTVLAAGTLAGALVEAGGVAAAVRRPAVAVGAVAAAAAAAAVEEAGPGVAVTTTVAVTGCFVTGVTKSRWPALTSQLTVATSTTAAAAAAAYPSLLRRGARRPDGPTARTDDVGPAGLIPVQGLDAFTFPREQVLHRVLVSVVTHRASSSSRPSRRRASNRSPLILPSDLPTGAATRTPPSPPFGMPCARGRACASGRARGWPSSRRARRVVRPPFPSYAPA